MFATIAPRSIWWYGSRNRTAFPPVLYSFARYKGTTAKGAISVQSVSPHAPLGVSAALQGKVSEKPKPKIFDEFSLKDRVGIVSGGNRGLGLEMALALCEAGARAIYCLDLPTKPSAEWEKTRDFLKKMDIGAKLKYVSIDVTDQQSLWNRVAEIGDEEGRMDVCVAAAGILKAHTDCLRYPAAQFKEVLDVNTNGVLYTAQAAGQQMERFGHGGSIILIASMSGTITNRDHAWVSYNSSKSAVLQMARSMACELGEKNIRVNSLSPGHIYTSMTAAYLDKQPHLLEKWSNLNPMGRIGRPDEMRGVCVWLASGASSFCTGSDIIVSGGHHSW
ncbi:sorbose reductase sou1 [Coprinopsis marcescibilis]|uniref:Sorbose reductase sou1 n=1 Tax=Coprinopsis marcescibilis TaxID=230819 RepID=A0A5C3L0F1_COPMA|nr:sorbose reductase sou1 [Coprinopsis marcescibilis]